MSGPLKILLLGKDGQLGWELRRSLAPLGSVVALGRGSTSHAADFLRPAGLAETVHALRPDVVVNAAAYTSVDQAEREPEVARAVNALAPAALARAAHEVGAWLVHYSTDYVFDGSGERPWVESDAPGPLNVYGRTKLEGDLAVAANCERHLILRTSWVYSVRGGNFARTMLRLAQERERLSVVADQVGAPTGADLLADVTAHGIREAFTRPGLAGLYHLAAAGEVSWHGYASFVLTQARTAGMVLRTAAGAIDAVPSMADPRPAARPANSRLNSTKLERALRLNMPHWQQGVARMVCEILQAPSS